MDLNVVAFPALIMSDDGWVQHVDGKEQLSTWSHHAIRKYSRRHLVLLDSANRGWEVEVLEAADTGLRAIFRKITNSRVPVNLSIREIKERPFEAARGTLENAIEMDDDALTQHGDSRALRDALNKTQTFRDLLKVLQDNKAV
jgi:hypothetical protein